MIKGKMKAALLYGIRDLRLEEVDIPEIGPNDILARVRIATTCGTDLKMFRRGYISGVVEYPYIMGHEWAGDIVEVGKNIKWLEEGMRIRAGNSAPCFRCTFCRVGKYNLCENRTWLWGSFAEYIKVPEPIVKHNLHIMPDSMTYEEGALVEPFACVLHGNFRSEMKPGDSVVIIGAGAIGLMHAIVAKMRGAGKVIVVDLIEERLKIAEKLAADFIVNGSETDAVQEVKKLTDMLGADIVIEAVGLPQTWEEAIKMVRNGGNVVLFGGCKPGTKITVDTELLHYEEINLIGSFHANPSEFNLAFKLISSRTVDLRPLVTRKMPLDKVHEAFNLLEKSKKDIKIGLLP
ncbi:MAG: zinc-binding dehydrogenase [Candidatus Korarchaeota archaeon]|nr:zinc-binding dehydrogenase [Candidatus Korarchaeota archaeon]